MVEANNVLERSELERGVMRSVCAGLTEDKSRNCVEIVSPAIGWYGTIPLDGDQWFDSYSTTNSGRRFNAVNHMIE
ncbi:hypothetical protein PHMEG_00019440 [Phytophthora megakarya]|uniref:Uncharacterized protein n=1 Tax=Phytophthora megakarya TaxID=4795 RepID=A0A225VST5_9STRA|nr:hypothetical protein PHMEG_00019440 [Phytophthora megakarya]